MARTAINLCLLSAEVGRLQLWRLRHGLRLRELLSLISIWRLAGTSAGLGRLRLL